MRTQTVWQEQVRSKKSISGLNASQVPSRDGAKSIIYDIAFKPDGTMFVAACGQRVLMYDAEGELISALKGWVKPHSCWSPLSHRPQRYCVLRFVLSGWEKIRLWRVFFLDSCDFFLTLFQSRQDRHHLEEYWRGNPAIHALRLHPGSRIQSNHPAVGQCYSCRFRFFFFVFSPKNIRDPFLDRTLVTRAESRFQA